MANTATDTVAAAESTNGDKAKRRPISMKVATDFFDEIPAPVKLARGRGQDLAVFQIFVQYLESDNVGKAARIEFVDSDSAKQKAGQLRTAMVEGKYPVPDGWEWIVAARPILDKDGKNTGSALWFQTSKKLGKNAKGKATTTDEVKKRVRKAKAEGTETAPAES